MEQLGVMSLAAVARANGHEVMLALGSEERIVRVARDFRPDVVGFCVLTGFQTRWLKVARSIKRALDPEPLIIFGGPHPTFFPKVVLEDGVDLVCRGEGEGAMADLLDAVDAGNERFDDIPNLVVKNDFGLRSTPLRPLANLDELPFPNREISFAYPFIRKDPNVHFMAGRGCPYSCSFCFNRSMRELCRELGPPVRMRSVDNLIEEIDGVNRKWGIEVVYFQDDTFVLDRDWLFDFLDRYASCLRLPFYCTVRADLVTADMARALRDAGCYRVSFGVESGVERIRREVLKKNVSDEQIREAASILHDAGITFQTTNMMGLPGETLADAVRTLELNIQIGADIAWTSIYQPYPGTELGDRTLAEGRVDKLPDDERIADAHTSSILRQPEIEEVVRFQKFAYLAVKFPSTLPFILELTRRNHPILYYYIHRITYLLFYFKQITHMSWRRVVHEAWVAWRHYR